MAAKLAPIGFEKIYSNEMKVYIGFEQFEDEQQNSPTRVYPLDDTMPIPIHLPPNNYFPMNQVESIPDTRRSHTAHTTNSHESVKRTLSHPQLSTIYNEIANEWSKIQWLTFTDSRTKTYLTLFSDSAELVTIETAIQQYQPTSASTVLLSLPECLLIRTNSKTRAVFLPNSTLSIENLCDKDVDQHVFVYKLLAILCHSNETNSQIMFYKNLQFNCWYIYYDQCKATNSHSNLLSNEEQIQMDLFVQSTGDSNQIDLTKFSSSLSNLFNHPIVFVYLPEKHKET
ncbi:unnamed protein product [Adineta ricciae]|uniref:Uncharacterized protein n=1 Tax=Adineta ricciae TaxID=249248 RepID=A0A813RPY9_ADIRI|nr:unnamed protein product [Adineta ricciae]CAF1558532.1 unnamed protein product [Adineta ricciae]